MYNWNSIRTGEWERERGEILVKIAGENFPKIFKGSIPNIEEVQWTVNDAVTAKYPYGTKQILIFISPLL